MIGLYFQGKQHRVG